MSRLKAKIEGQTLVEFTIGLSAVLLSITLGGWILHAEWQRNRCAYLTFENTHQALVGSPKISLEVKIDESDSAIQGEAWCKGVHEKVQFNKL